METDDKIRGCSGVVCSLRDIGNGKIRLILDDVSKKNKSTNEKWEHEVVFTWNDYKSKDIMENKLTNKELINIAHNLIARLSSQENIPY